jgi:hypothetical protein
MMKGIILAVIILITITGSFRGNTQNIPTYPIPSKDISVNGLAIFQENYHIWNINQFREKRDLNVHPRSVSGSQNCQSTVWVYSLDGLDKLGPFTVLCGETLTVEIDEREWGVLIETGSETLVDVWIE